MTKIIDGKSIANDIREEIRKKVIGFSEINGRAPGLAVLLVGEDPASKVYVRMKEKACEKAGIKSVVRRETAATNEEKVINIVKAWNNDSNIDGILVQIPLPDHINENKVINAISPSKDVDGLHPENFGRLVLGLPGFVPCTPAGIMELLKRSDINMKGKHAVVIGRSNLVGKPITNLLYQKNADANAIVTICHTAADDLVRYARQADVLIAAVGSPEIIKAEHIKEGAAIIDVGVNRVDDETTEKGYRLTGDVDFKAVKDKTSAITPVPGGVGPMTIAMLMQNTYKSASGEIFNE